MTEDLKRIMGDKDNMVYVDEMARQLGTFMHTKRLSILVLAHSQIYIDIYSALGPRAHRGREQMKGEVGRMITTIERDYVTDVAYVARPGDRGPPKIAKSDKRVRLYTDLLEHRVMANRDTMRYWAERDPIKEEKLDAIKKLRLRSRERCSYHFLDHSPMFCGLMLFRFRLRFRDTSLDLVNRYAHIMAAAHLYIAATIHVGTSPSAPRLQPWPLMDKILELHGKEDICGGETPTTILELLDCVLAAYGSPTQLRDAMRDLGSGHPTKEQLLRILEPKPMKPVGSPRRLEDRARVLPIFSDRYLQDLRPAANLDVQRMEALTRELDPAAGHQAQPAGSKAATSRKLSVFEMLDIVQAGLTHEAALLRFNYLDAQREALDVLHAVRDSVPAVSKSMHSHTDGALKVLPAAVLQEYWTLGTAASGSSRSRSKGEQKQEEMMDNIVAVINRCLATWQVTGVA